tara:strand:- start:61 stop:1587 length:1527 start_codon:yes stop_codon:yes gene_type:complete
MNGNHHFFTVYGNKLRQRKMEVMQAASQELAAQGAMDQQRIQVLMKMLEMEQKKLGALKKAKVQLGKSLLKETGGAMDMYQILHLQTQLSAQESSEDKVHMEHARQIEKNIRKKYEPSEEQGKRATIAVEKSPDLLLLQQRGQDLDEKVINFKNNILSKPDFDKALTDFKTTLQYTQVGSAVAAQNFISQLMSKHSVPSDLQDETREVIGRSIYPGHWETYKKNMGKDTEEYIDKVVEEKLDETFKGNARRRRKIRDQTERQMEKLQNKNPQAAKILQEMMVPSEDMIKTQKEIDRLKADIETKVSELESPTYEKVATRAGEILLGEEARREASNKMKAGLAEKILGMPDEEAEYYRAAGRSKKYLGLSDDELGKQKGIPEKFVSGFLKGKDTSWSAFNKQAQAEIKKPADFQTAQAVMASRIVRAGQQASGNLKEKVDIAQKTLKTLSPVVPEAPKAPQFVHKVAKNDTLWDIARTYDTSVKKLKELNKLSGKNPVITPGQEIIYKE